MPETDARPAIVVMKQYREVMYLRSQLIKQGLVGKDATAAQVVEALRAAVPAHLFTDDSPS